MKTFAEIRDSTRKLPKPEKPVVINGFMPTHSTGGPAWNDGLRAATPVQHTDGKNDGADIGRPPAITR